jgi:hypothetical protein
MPPVRYPLEAVGGTNLDAAGNGSITLRPTSSRETWVVDGAAVTALPVAPATAVVSEPTCNVFNTSIGNKLGGTYTGSNDQIGLSVTIRGGSILAQWTGGDPGARVELSLTGYRTMTRS